MKIIAQMGNSIFIIKEKDKLYNVQIRPKTRVITNIPNSESWMKSGYWKEPNVTESQQKQIEHLIRAFD